PSAADPSIDEPPAVTTVSGPCLPCAGEILIAADFACPSNHKPHRLYWTANCTHLALSEILLGKAKLLGGREQMLRRAQRRNHQLPWGNAGRHLAQSDAGE